MAPAGEVVNSLSVLSLNSRTPDVTGCGQQVTAQLLLDAQERLREAFMPCHQPLPVPPASSLYPQLPSEDVPYSDVQTAPLDQMLPTMPSLDSSTTLLATPFAPIDQPPPACPPKTAAALALLTPLPSPRDCRSAASTPKRGAPVPAEEDALRDECMGESSSEGDSHSTRSSGAGSKKRKRHACPSSGDARADAWVGDLLMERRGLQARCAELEASNARLVCHLTLALRMLQQERASAQAEARTLRQKCNALGAFLPPSVAAFARGVPPDSDQVTRKGMLRAPSQPA